jgi:biopolymer transport protein ExbB/TolQ
MYYHEKQLQKSENFIKFGFLLVSVLIVGSIVLSAYMIRTMKKQTEEFRIESHSTKLNIDASQLSQEQNSKSILDTLSIMENRNSQRTQEMLNDAVSELKKEFNKPSQNQ